MKTNTFLEKLLQGAPVEWKTLGEVAKLQRGRVISKQYLSENIGDYPVYSSQTANNGEIGTISTFDFDQEAITWTTDGANAGTVFHRFGKFSITNVCGLVNILDLQKLDYKFLFYWLSIEAKKYVYSGMGNPKLMSNQMEKIKIPIPPLAVQKEIARILDALTALTSELTSELTLRQKQYQYYRDQLLTFGDEVEWKTIEEIFNLKNGYTPSKSKKEYWENGTIPWFRMEDIRENGRVLDSSLQKVSEAGVKGGKLFKANSFIIATSATIGEHALIKVPFLANQRFTNLELKDAFKAKFSTKFIFYYCFLLDEWCKKNITKSSFSSVDMASFKKFKFPIPPIEEQKRIATILDKFHTLTHSLSEGLPKEIELRQKQYEYYRDLLLGFDYLK